jgi:CHAD domain-containing protein
VTLEREAKFAVEPDFVMPDLSAPGDGLHGRPMDTERFVSTYHDTGDLRLVRWGGSLRVRTGQGWTVKLPHAADGVVVARHEIVFQGAADRPPADAIDLLRGIVRGGGLAPVARLQTVRRRTCIAADDDARPVAEVVDDEVSVLDGRRVVDRFREVEVELAEGVGSADVAPVLASIVAGGARPGESISKVARALGARAVAAPDVVVPDVGPASAVGDVIAWAIAGSVVRLVGHDAAVRLGEDPEGVHQARVATRRLRSHLRTFGAMLEGDWRDGLRAELRWLGDELGAVRDLDVLEERIRRHGAALPDDEAAGVMKVLERVHRRREAARSELLAAMHEPRYVELLDALVDAASNPRVLAEVADARAVDVLGVVMDAPWEHLRTRCRKLELTSGDAALHDARIRAKRVRYAAESLVPVFGKPARRFARRTEALQQVLGAHQDAVVATTWLRHEAMHAPARMAFAAGRLAAIEASAHDDARAGWPEAWKRLRRTRPRFWR